VIGTVAGSTASPLIAGRGAQTPAQPAQPGQPAQATADAAAAQPKPAAPTGPAATPLVAEPSERDVRVETRDVIAVFTNRGARLKSWRLKHYFNQQREPQELVEHELSSQPLPFTLRTANDTVTATLNDALYFVSGAPPAPAEASAVDVLFEYRDSAGLHAVKAFHFEPASYVVTFRATIVDQDRAVTPTIIWGPAIGDVGEISRYTKKAEGLLFLGEKIQRLATKDIAKQADYDGDFRYAGVDDNYFMAAALFPGPIKVSYQPLSIPPPGDSKDAPRELVSFSLEPKQADTPIRFFVGPKDFDVLSAVDRDVARAIDFGMFAVIVVPLLRSLKWVNGYVGNYGWAIIILTFMINAIMFPLRHKSVVSMRKMQEIQPQVKAIQDRYSKLKAADPAKQKMNTELMALYKEKGVNPASGCVPMLLTFPFIFAFYALLSVAIELRGAPFFGWIHDLSAHDPYFVTPILMGISQIWQQRLAPATGMDPAQQKMMMVMPVFFTFLFLWYPAGVALYWLVNNLWAIGQQYATNYMIGPPNVRAARPPAERRMKRVGGGKTEAAARES
jgi:YidC/Oxa1 family membrane protein insertase